MSNPRPILGEIAYPPMVGGVPRDFFILNLMVHSFAALLTLLEESELMGLVVFLIVASMATIHFLTWRVALQDPHFMQVWKQYVTPPDYRRPGARTLLRTPTRNLKAERGRKYTV